MGSMYRYVYIERDTERKIYSEKSTGICCHVWHDVRMYRV